MKTWTMELTEDELIALAKACSSYVESIVTSGQVTVEELLASQLLIAVDKKFPSPEWFSDEVKV